MRRELKEGSRENFGVEFIEHLDHIGCTDGYSRRIIWLEVSLSNKSPNLIANYYFKTAKNLNGIPKTERNTHIIEPIHLFLRDLSNEGNVLNSFSIVLSPRNQRIEASWSNFRKDRLGWWKHFLQDFGRSYIV